MRRWHADEGFEHGRGELLGRVDAARSASVDEDRVRPDVGTSATRLSTAPRSDSVSKGTSTSIDQPAARDVADQVR